MISGEREAILKGLSHPGAIYRMNAIGQVYLNNMRDAEIIEKLKVLKADDVMLDGYTVGDFAVAALHNFGMKDEEIVAGERIAQLVIMPYYTAEFEISDELGVTARGDGGFGSTGK